MENMIGQKPISFDEGIIRLLSQEYEVSPVVVKEIIGKYFDLRGRPSMKSYSHGTYVNEDKMCSICLCTYEYCKHGRSNIFVSKEEKVLLVLNTFDEAQEASDTLNNTNERKVSKMNIDTLLEDKVIADYEAGETIQSISRKHNVFAPYVSAILKDAGISVRRGRSKGSTFMRNSISNEVVKTLVVEYKAGTSVNTLSDKYDIAPTKVSNILKTQGIIIPRGRPQGNNGINESKLTQAKELYAMGKGVVAIAKELHVNPAELSTALKEDGVVIRRGRKASA
jgi:hypothetical protein